MTTAQLLHKQFTQLVRELNDQGLQLDKIEEHSEIQRIGLALWGAVAVRNEIRSQIRRALQTDIDKETGVRNRISSRNLNCQWMLPLAWLDCACIAMSMNVTPETQLMTAEEIIKINNGRMKKSGIFLESELKAYSKVGKTVLKSAEARLHQSNGSDIVE